MSRNMMDQYMEIKSANPDTVLFFRMGDFYEMFHDDAVIVSEVLGLTLTSRDKKADNPIPMAGFPWHALETNLKKMLAKGHKVTLCEQEDELRPGAKLLERVVTRIFTPGSIYEESLLKNDQSALLSSIICKNEKIGYSILDPSTGKITASQFEGVDRYERLLDEIIRGNPSEIVLTKKDTTNEMIVQILSAIDNTSVSQHNISEKIMIDSLKRTLEVHDLGHLDLDNSPVAMKSAGLVSDYIAKLHVSECVPLRSLDINEEESGLLLDQTTIRNLEISKTLSGEYEGTLIQSIDHVKTWMGRRLMRSWIMKPLRDKNTIIKRQNAVSSLCKSSRKRKELRTALTGLRDMERLAMQLSYGRVNGRDLIAISECLEKMHQIENSMSEFENELLNEISEGLTGIDHIRENIQSALIDQQPLSIKEGGMFRGNYNKELDNFREKISNAKKWLSDLEINERGRLEIPSLKVKQNRQFGWFIEITNSHLPKVPEEYVRKQTMTNGERYITEELKDWEDILVNADTKGNSIEYSLFCELRDNCKIYSNELATIAEKIAMLDVLCCFAHVAQSRNWCKPEISDDYKMSIKDARHPVLDNFGGYVPNDVILDSKRNFTLITGPNMGGKSTYMRQVALISILAQAGSYVPATKAKIGLIDRIFTRIGAGDDIRKGRSTFMMEMIEVAHILRRASEKSLVLLDEIGRGTSTFDGLSIAWAVTEEICNKIKCRTLFATHYHQLIGLEEHLEGLHNIHMQVSDSNEGLRFLYTIGEGPCDESYGIHVGILAGLPPSVIERSRELLHYLEERARMAEEGDGGAPEIRDIGQSSLYSYLLPEEVLTKLKSSTIESVGNNPVATIEETITEGERAVIEHLAGINPDELSPRDALERIFELHDILNGKRGMMEE